MIVSSSSSPFLWGAATASYQIEGAADADGRGPSIWDAFCERPGAVENGESGRHACDHYRRWREDLDLLAELGIQAYRFSIAWPRIFPEGRGRLEQRGLDFYSRLVDGLLERGIAPMATLYHWDLPQALEDEGGWENRETARAFADYAALVAGRLGDRVAHWTTLNEMPVVIYYGHEKGYHAPGKRLDAKGVRQVAHHVLLAHGLGVQALRAELPAQAAVGLVHNPAVPEPLLETPENVEAARADFERLNAWLLDPVFRSSYPTEAWEAAGPDVPDVEEGDLKTIGSPLDYLGLNIYTHCGVTMPDGTRREYAPWHPRTDMGWPVTPDCLYWGCRFACETYAPARLYITENGCAWPDQVNARGEVDDFARIAYMRAHLRGVERAVEEGLPLRGYFAWSLLDNFEWHRGYAKRFGIVHVNYETYKRTPKASARWYARLIESGKFQDKPALREGRHQPA